MNIKTYYVLTSENEEYWTYDNYFKKYTRFLLTPLNRQKLLKFSSLEKAQKEASKIMEESICLSDDINKVFIEPMVIDEEKNDCTQNTILCIKRMFLEICLTKVYK